MLPTAIRYLFKDEEVEEDHAEVVHDEGSAELEGLSVLHVLGPQPEEQQVGGADGQRGQRVVHQRPFLHPFVCVADVLISDSFIKGGTPQNRCCDSHILNWHQNFSPAMVRVHL